MSSHRPADSRFEAAARSFRAQRNFNGRIFEKADAAPVKSCRTCHFQEGNVPDGKEMAVATYKDAKGKEEKKELNNEQAFHINCNNCHDAAAKLRPELKKKPGFATSNDCFICHKKN